MWGHQVGIYVTLKNRTPCRKDTIASVRPFEPQSQALIISTRGEENTAKIF